MDHFVEGAGGCFCSRGKPRPVWEIVTRFGRRFRVAVSPRGSIGKLHPSLNGFRDTVSARCLNRKAHPV